MLKRKGVSGRGAKQRQQTERLTGGPAEFERMPSRMTIPRTDAETRADTTPCEQRTSLSSADLERLAQKLKLLEYGLYGLQQYGRNAPLDVEDIGPFCRLAEEIESDVLALIRRLTPFEAADPS
jgi:hypothetical protein